MKLMIQYKSMIGLCISAFLMMLGVGMIVALLPQRMLNLTGQASSAAYLTSAFAFSYVLLQVPYGNLSDRFGFKRFLVFGYLLCALTGLLYFSARTVNLILFGRLLQGAGEAPVSRAVVDDHALPIPEGLAPHAAQAGVERRRCVEDGQQDRDAGSGHGGRV